MLVNPGREALRRLFMPKRVSVVFVGESPAGGTFFYAGDSMLFRATRDAFSAALGTSNDAFLDEFAALGCYLDDLCLEPVNQLCAGERMGARREGEVRLARALAALAPCVIVVLLHAIEDNVARAAAAAGLAHVERHVVTYPSRWHAHRVAYHRELTALLRDFARRGVLAKKSRSGLPN
jgi:hypothetical protein